MLRSIFNSAINSEHSGWTGFLCSLPQNKISRSCIWVLTACHSLLGAGLEGFLVPWWSSSFPTFHLLHQNIHYIIWELWSMHFPKLCAVCLSSPQWLPWHLSFMRCKLSLSSWRDECFNGMRNSILVLSGGGEREREQKVWHRGDTDEGSTFDNRVETTFSKERDLRCSQLRSKCSRDGEIESGDSIFARSMLGEDVVQITGGVGRFVVDVNR